MGRRGSKNQKENTSNWRRQNLQKKTLNRRRQQREKILKKAKEEPLKSTELLFLLSKIGSFIGCFPCDQLKTIYILRHPVFFIINTDISTLPGSHWIAVRIGNSTVEIFDSLGFSPNLWNSYPTEFLLFLNRYRASHRFLISPILQPPNTFYCGLYCVFYILYRQKISFKNCLDKFSRDLTTNNLKLDYLLEHKF